jgi:hypothetical protein
MSPIKGICVSVALVSLRGAAELPSITPAGTFVTGAAVNAIASEGRYVYLVDNSKTVRNIDFANPDAPAGITWRDLQGEGVSVTARGSIVATTDRSRRVTFFDFADPTSPVTLKALSFANIPQGVGLTDDLALVSVAFEGVHVYDISDRANPVEKGMIVAADLRDTVIHARTAFIAEAFSGVRIVDFSDPRAAVTLGSCSAAANAVALAWPLLYVASGFEKATLEVFNVSNPAQPQRLGSYTVSNPANSSMALDIAAFGPLVALPSQKYGFDIFDVSAPALPKSIFHEEAYFAKLVAVSRDLVIFYDENAGLKAYRVSVPAAPKLTIVSSGDTQVVSWPGAFGGYSVRTADSLGGEWQPVAGSAVSLDNKWTYSMNASGTRFLQLVK